MRCIQKNFMTEKILHEMIDVECILSDNFKVIGNWQFGQGYTDILTNSMILSEIEESSLFEELMSISNEVQKVVDENEGCRSNVGCCKKLIEVSNNVLPIW